MESTKTLKERVENFLNHGGTLEEFAQLYVENGEGTAQDFLDDYGVSIIGGDGSIFDRIGRGIESIWKTIINVFTTLWTWLDNILKAIGELNVNITNGILNGLKELLKSLFVPSQERLTAIQNTVSSKFAFIDSVKTGISSVENMLNNIGNSPKINLTIPASTYTNEMNLDVIDMSWYAPYKNYGDVVFTGFIYFAFIWRIYINLSNIINGNSGRALSSVDPISRIEELKD